jgi:hypothetical protein
MNRAETLSRIESDRFSALVNAASNLKTFLRAVGQQSEITELAAVMHCPEVSREVCERALALASAEVNEDYEHPGDAALAVYLWLLSNHNAALARRAAAHVLQVRHSWWSRKVAERILAGHPNNGQEFFVSTPTGNDEDQAKAGPPTGAQTVRKEPESGT